MRSGRGALARAGEPGAVSVDVVTVAVRDGRLTALVEAPAQQGSPWSLPWAWLGRRAPDTAATALLGDRPGVAGAWIAQLATLGGDEAHPGRAGLSVGYLAVTAAGPPDARTWRPLDAIPLLTPRHRTLVRRARDFLRGHSTSPSVAFAFLRPTFTLRELQEVVELLGDRPLHKASFRRVLVTARAVQPTRNRTSEGRGRPAQLFRRAPSRQREVRPWRFDA